MDLVAFGLQPVAQGDEGSLLGLAAGEQAYLRQASS